MKWLTGLKQLTHKFKDLSSEELMSAAGEERTRVWNFKTEWTGITCVTAAVADGGESSFEREKAVATNGEN